MYNDWIDAKTSPQKDGTYIVYGVEEFVPDHVDEPSERWTVMIAYYYSPFGWSTRVKYWMPLPEKPEG